MDFDVIKSTHKNPKTPIIFLHGWGGSKDSFKFLAQEFRERDLWFVSFAGHGNSAQPTTPMHVIDFANQVVEFIQQNNIPKCHLVAHSFGGRVALILLSKHPQLFSQAVLTGCAGLPTKTAKTRLKIAIFKAKKWLVKLHLKNPKCLQNSGSADYKVLSPTMRQTFKYVVNQNLKPYAKKIQTPTLLIWGQNDSATPLKIGKKLHKYIKNSELIVFLGKSHFCFYEEPLRFALILQYYFV